MTNTFITGSQGFIGKRLCKKLGADNYVPINHEDIQNTDFSDAENIYFLSTYGNLFHQKDINKTIKANLNDLIYVASSVDWKKIRSFVYFSTSSVKLPMQTPYSRAKRAAEEVLLSYMEHYDVPVTIIRPMSVTGVGEQGEHLIPTLIRSCLFGEHMDFVAEPVHDFIDVEDVVDGTLHLLNFNARGIFELGNGVAYSNKDVLNIVQAVTKKKANINLVKSLRAYDNDRWVSTNFKAYFKGWKPIISLTQSVTAMVEDIKRAN